MRHIDVKNLWIQGLVRSGRIVLQKVRGDENPADVLTKFLDLATCIVSLARAGVRIVAVERHARAEGGVEPSEQVSALLLPLGMCMCVGTGTVQR